MSKKSWTRLLNFCKFGSVDERVAKLNYLFYTHHKNCDEFINLKTGEPLVAVYFHPDAIQREQIKAIMKEIQHMVLFAFEEDK